MAPPRPAPTLLPNTPQALTLTQGPGGDLTVTWTQPTADDTHSAATSFNVRFSLSGAANWTTVANVASPHVLSGLAAGTTFDVQVQSANAVGVSEWSATGTLATTTEPSGPYAPSITAFAPPPDGQNSKLIVSWTGSAGDASHTAATGYTLRHRPAGTGSWTTVPGATSPWAITGLAGATAIDVEVQANDAASRPSEWSAAAAGKTWGAIVVPGGWVAAATQVHATGVAPNGGVQMTVTAAPTAVTGAAFCWSTSQSILPTSNLVTALPDGQTNGWGQYFQAPPAPGIYYLWMLAQGAGGVTTGALVSSAITVS